MGPQDLEAYVPVYDAIPESWEEGRQFLVEQMKMHSNAVNIREIGWYLDQEVLTGKQFIPGTTLSGNPIQYRSIFRKVVDTGALPNTTTKSVPHGITWTQNFQLIQMYGGATQPTINAIPLPYFASNPAINVSMYIDPTNILITTTFNGTPFSSSFVVVEYIQEG